MLPFSAQEKSESNELQGDCLDFLVNFCNQAKEAGLLDDMFSEKEDKDVSLQSTGAKPKAAPPLSLDQAMSSMKPPEPQGPPPMKVQAAASSKHALQLPSVPSPVHPTSSQGRLVVSPHEMKKFLYGTQQQSTTSASGPSTSQGVSCFFSIFHVHDLLHVICLKC